MKTLENVKPNWKDNPPTYANMCDKSTMEWNLAEEIRDVKNELQVIGTYDGDETGTEVTFLPDKEISYALTALC